MIEFRLTCENSDFLVLGRHSEQKESQPLPVDRPLSDVP
jgi:hypothetical protein